MELNLDTKSNVGNNSECEGCGGILSEIESGETTHGCNCGKEMSAEFCIERKGICESCALNEKY